MRIEFSTYVYTEEDKIVVSDIDGTITKSDTKGFFGGALGYNVHHEGVNMFLRGLNENGYKTIYLTARSMRYMSYTKNYLFEKITVNDVDGVSPPRNPILCIHHDLALGALGDESKSVLGKSSCLNNVVSLFTDSSAVFVGAYGNKSSDTEAYTNVGIPLSKIFIINKQSKIMNAEFEGETTYKQQGEDLNTLFPKF